MDRKGSVLMVALWIIAILVIFSLGLGQRAAIALKLARYQRDGLKANYLAKSGVNQAIAILRLDQQDPETSLYDTIAECGVKLDGKQLESLFFRQWDDEKESFKVGYYSAGGEFIYGMRDEESRININGIDGVDHKALLTQVLKSKNISDYEGIADLLVNWIDSDKEPDKVMYKNEPLTSPQELLAVLEYYYTNSGVEKKEARKKSQGVYNEIRDLITTCVGKININTASREVLMAVANSCAQNAQELEAVAKVVDGIIALREGGAVFKQKDDLTITLAGAEQALFDNLMNETDFKSENFRIDSYGNVFGLTRHITTIINSSGEKIFYWHEN